LTNNLPIVDQFSTSVNFLRVVGRKLTGKFQR